MPIESERDDRRRLITLTVTEPFSFDDLVRQAARQWTEDTWAYAILYDLRATEHGATSAELQQVAEGIRAIGSGRPRGPMGVAIPPRPEKLRRGLQFASLATGVPSEVIILDLKGPVGAGQWRRAAQGHGFNSLLNQGHKQIVLNLVQVPYIDSAGLGEIVRTYTSVRPQGGSVKLMNPTKDFTHLLSITRAVVSLGRSRRK